jgi:multimeric flavodoxin WrbA
MPESIFCSPEKGRREVLNWMKKVLGIVGSPRKRGNTHLLVESILDGARDGGAETRLLFLDDQEILECVGCHACWKGKPCSRNDDMNDLYEMIAESDVLVFGTPVYWYGPTALMKGFIDRFVYFNCPENRARLENKTAVLAIPFEEEDPGTAGLVVSFFEKSFSYLGIDLIGTVLAPGVTKRGEIKKEKAKLGEGYELGRQAVTGSGVSKQTGSGARYYPKEELALRPDVPGARMWAVALKNTMLTYFELEPGSRFERHSHGSEQITLVLEGALFFELEDRTERVGMGEVIAIPPDIPHAVYTKEKKTRAVDAWSPVMRDYAG